MKTIIKSKWSVIRDVLNLIQAPEILMPADSELLCDKLANFLTTMTQNLSANIRSRTSTLSEHIDVVPKYTGEFFSIIKSPRAHEVLKFINSISSRSSPIVNIPVPIKSHGQPFSHHRLPNQPHYLFEMGFSKQPINLLLSHRNYRNRIVTAIFQTILDRFLTCLQFQKYRKEFSCRE